MENTTEATTTEATTTEATKEVSFSKENQKNFEVLGNKVIQGTATAKEFSDFKKLTLLKQKSEGKLASRTIVEKTPLTLKMIEIYESEEGQKIKEEYALLNETSFIKLGNALKCAKFDKEVFLNFLNANMLSTELRVSTSEKNENGKGYISINQGEIKEMYYSILNIVEVEELKEVK